MPGDFLFRRSADELRAAFAPAAGDLVKFCALILSECEDVGALDSETACHLQRSNLFIALRSFFQDNGRDEQFPRFTASLLHSATAVLRYAEEKFGDDQEEFTDYFIPREPEHTECSIGWVRGVLANAFLGNIDKDAVRNRKDAGNFGGLNFGQTMFNSRQDPVGFAKISCLVQYFVSSDPAITGSVKARSEPSDGYDNYMDLLDPRQRKVVFQKLHMTNAQFKKVLEADSEQKEGNEGGRAEGCNREGNAELESSMQIHEASMEIHDAHAFVNFANPNYGYGKFITSCTQEEILQMCCPEMNVGMLFYGKMDDNSVVLTHNVRRFSAYSGYLDSFAFEGAVEEGPEGSGAEGAVYQDQTLVAMDAVYGRHYTDECNLRDTKKAYMAWKGVRDWHQSLPESAGANRAIRISTGRWGCGAFGGVVPHKFLQQRIALGLVNREKQRDALRVQLLFSCFHDPDTRLELEKMEKELRGVPAREAFERILVGGDASKFARRNMEGLLALIAGVKSEVAPTGGAGAPSAPEKGDGLEYKERSIEDIDF